MVRRLDENTGPDNFLSHAFKVRVDSDDWRRLEQQFVDCFTAIDTVSAEPRRTQDRRQGAAPPATGDTPWQQFVNEPDTDFTLPQNGAWAEELVAAWHGRCGDQAVDIPLYVAGEVNQLFAQLCPASAAIIERLAR